MQNLIKRFDLVLKLLLIFNSVCVLLAGVFAYVNISDQVIPFIDPPRLGMFLTSMLIVSFSLGTLYFVVGTVLLIVYIFRKNTKDKIKFAYGLLIKGFISVAVSFLLFFFMSVILSIFHGVGGGTLTLPKLPGNDYPVTGFPVSDLKIESAKKIGVCDDQYCECEVKIKNHSSTLTAVNVALSQANGLSNGYVSMDETIPPGGTFPIQIMVDQKVGCDGFTIDDAGILE